MRCRQTRRGCGASVCYHVCHDIRRLVTCTHRARPGICHPFVVARCLRAVNGDNKKLGRCVRMFRARPVIRKNYV